MGGITRSLPYLTNFNLEITSLIFCKCRIYFVHFSLILGRYFICLISIDRWMVTSSNQSIRRMSSSKFARYITTVGTCFCLIFSIHAPIGFEIKNNRCYAYLATSYEVFYGIYNLIAVGIPIILMILCSTLIMVNIHQRQNRIYPSNSLITGSHEVTIVSTPHNNMQLIRLVLIQSLTFLVLNISVVAYTIYDFATISITKSSNRQIIEAFIYAVSIHPNYIFCSITFLTYTLASSMFRKEFIFIGRRLYNNALRQCGQ
ncbi:unnamed protein product [Rotaria sp. Silwood1]|nr:unnamed protein product [Rotaria sp. Silwood1]